MQIEIENKNVDQFFTEYEKVNRIQTVSTLNDQSVFYIIIKINIFNEPADNLIFTFDNRYSASIFQDIILNSGAVKVLTVEEP
jgi:hypothetical protein